MNPYTDFTEDEMKRVVRAAARRYGFEAVDRWLAVQAERQAREHEDQARKLRERRSEATTGATPESEGGGCTLAGPGRGDCEHFIGLPGKSMPGQHDGPDDTVDVYGKPNGWCWRCWLTHQHDGLVAAAKALLPYIEGDYQGVQCLVCAQPFSSHTPDCPIGMARAALAKAKGK
jgi:hypothetical protein